MSTILIIDDNAVVRQSLRHALEQTRDWSVAEASGGQEGVERARAIHPDLVVLDFVMPGMNGLEAAARIKRFDPYIPLIMVTAYKNDSLERHAYETGFSVVIAKDEIARRLIESVRILVRYGRKGNALREAMPKVQSAEPKPN